MINKKIVNLIFSLVCLVNAGGFVILHNWENINGPSKGLWGEFHINFRDKEELIKFITDRVKETQNMNPTEILLWVLYPTLLFWIILLLWLKVSKAITFALFPILFVVLITTAQVTNVIGASRVLEKELVIWGKMLDDIEFSEDIEYQLDRCSSFEGCDYKRLSYKSNRDIVEVGNYYVKKGFTRLEPDFNSEVYTKGLGYYLRIKQQDQFVEVSLSR